MTDGTPRHYEIHEVAELTGLAPARLRAWERRYAVVRPERQPNGYRAYSAEQVALLRAYARLIAAGERIGDLANEPVEQVLARAEGREGTGEPGSALLEAIRGLDRQRLEALVAQQLSLRGLRGFAHDVAMPLACQVGDLWALGRMTVAAEHLASEVVVHALKGGLRAARQDGPLLLAACMPGERHEWGVLATMADAQDRGWNVEYLGADLPGTELLEAAWAVRPAAVAVSGSDLARVDERFGELAALPGRLPPGVAAYAGGAGMLARAEALRATGFVVSETLPDAGRRTAA